MDPEILLPLRQAGVPLMEGAECATATIRNLADYHEFKKTSKPEPVRGTDCVGGEALSTIVSAAERLPVPKAKTSAGPNRTGLVAEPSAHDRCPFSRSRRS